MRVILWLADRMKLIGPPEEAEQDADLDDLPRGMADADLREFESLKLR